MKSVYKSIRVTRAVVDTTEVNAHTQYLPASVVFSFIVMGLCVVLGGSLLI